MCVGVWDKEACCQAKEAALGVLAWVTELNGHREERDSHTGEEEHIPQTEAEAQVSPNKRKSHPREILRGTQKFPSRS